MLEMLEKHSKARICRILNESQHDDDAYDEEDEEELELELEEEVRRQQRRRQPVAFLNILIGALAVSLHLARQSQ